MQIINTGGTFNKIYDPIRGELVVPEDSKAVEEIVSLMALDIDVVGIIFKDSLEMDEADRALLAQTIASTPHRSVVVVHGTDTMDRSAAFVAERAYEKCVVFTGAMIPYSIEPREAVSNLTLAIAKALYAFESGVFVAMHGLVAEYDRIYKDRKRGLFCLR